ncbi:Signal peptide peptidase 2 isoform A [Micractinium conductrix]|uniref:Signal peptide peptidase 2 isoform A n=1 Tax=Micractinium conductrix TaxID=554055 RepID=A0A2P6VJJ8_9CHLO|nr:Signal peptide peptidase 2 isoform A [Micractinium conductrix]|eukprot:PSC74237.1 Signal peptide peptidase 2 isoform A [Micractinium conductrix]
MAGDTAAAPAAHQHAPLQAPGAHAALALLFVAPLLVSMPTNANIVLTAALCVYVGCRRSDKPEPPQESMTKKDAMKFPLVGSLVLFSLFLAFKYLPKEIVNAILSAYFVFLGMLAIVACAAPQLGALAGSWWSEHEIELRVPSIPVLLKEGLEFSFTPMEGLAALPASAFCLWYYRRKHWFANNVLGLAFSLQGIEHLSLGAVQNGVILLCGLFFYDIFWVFGTPVMVSVAKNFEAPIKLLFPRGGLDDLVDGKRQFSMLGLGDIVIPGIFVAIVLRYDVAHGSRYFRSAFAGYVGGLAATIVVMNVFKAAQPALLYIVPGVLLATFAHAAARKEVSKLFHWQEKEHHEAKEAAKEAAGSKDGAADKKES